MGINVNEGKENREPLLGVHHMTRSATSSPKTEGKIGELSLSAITNTPTASGGPPAPVTSSEEIKAAPESLFTLSEELGSLTEAQREALQEHCMDAYAKSLPVFEKALAEVAAKHPDTKEFSGEMCRRFYAVLKALQEIKLEGKEAGWLKELQIKLNVAAALSHDQQVTGSVGFNPLAIEQVVKEGTLREQMSLTYENLLTALPQVLREPELVKQVNEKLEGDFALNSAAIESRRQVNAEDFFPLAPEIKKFRDTGGRIANPNPPEPKPRLQDVPDITIREARATLQDYISREEFQNMRGGGALGERRVEWVRGADLYTINKESDFYQKAVAMGKIPVLTGPSGTTDKYMLGCTYLGMESYKDAAVLALIGWMVPSGDHSLHEIRKAASLHGVPYQQGPAGFETIYPADPAVIEQVGDKLQKEGLHFPKYYLSPEYQKEVVNTEFNPGQRNLHF